MFSRKIKFNFLFEGPLAEWAEIHVEHVKFQMCK